MSTGFLKSATIEPNARHRLFLTFLVGAGCLLVSLVPLFVWTNPALASIVGNPSAPIPTQENLWAPVEIAKPTVTPIDARRLAPQRGDTPVLSESTGTQSTLV